MPLYAILHKIIISLQHFMLIATSGAELFNFNANVLEYIKSKRL
jgi:hypothetical protein